MTLKEQIQKEIDIQIEMFNEETKKFQEALKQGDDRIAKRHEKNCARCLGKISAYEKCLEMIGEMIG